MIDRRSKEHVPPSVQYAVNDSPTFSAPGALPFEALNGHTYRGYTIPTVHIGKTTPHFRLRVPAMRPKWSKNDITHLLPFPGLILVK